MRHGDIENGSLMAGQVAALVCRIEPAADIVDEMMADAEKLMVALGHVPSEA
jgi:enoyl-[acyl-carrier protein] reductase II